MAKTVFILGAGASASAGPPVVKDFVDKAHELFELHPPGLDVESFERTFDLLHVRFPALYARSTVDLSNIELIFNIVEMGRLLGRLPNTDASEVELMAAALRKVLAQTIEQTCLFRLSGATWIPSGEYLAFAKGLCRPRLFKDLPGPVAVITFNYDLALEAAIHAAGFGVDYHLPGVHIPDAAIPMLKLHGSLNWSSCSACRHLSVVDMRTALQSIGQPRRDGTPKPLMLTGTPVLLEHRCEEGAGILEQAIVSPSWNKGPFHQSIAGVWARAAKELSEASHIVVIGYSLPPADPFFKDLLTLGLVGRQRLKEFRVIDPSKEVGARFEMLLGPDVRHRFRHLPGTWDTYLHDMFVDNRLPS